MPHKIEIEMKPCLDFNSPDSKKPESDSEKKAQENWKNAYEKVKEKCKNCSNKIN